MNHRQFKILITEIVSMVIQEMGGLRGEWWFQDGNAVFADGDVGDMNHEAYVIDILKRKILESLGVDDSRYDYAPNFYEVAAEIFSNIEGELSEEEKEQWESGTNADVVEIIENYLSRKGDAETKEIIKYLTSSSLDVREYALKNWGWQRVKGNNIQTQTLTDRDIKNITGGLWEAYGNELEKDPNLTFNLEVMATRSWYTDIPWSVLSKDSTTSLNAYRSRYEQ